MWGSKPQPRQEQPKCYDDKYNPANYAYKSTEELLGWARNLRFRIRDMIAEKDYNAELCDKLQDRYEAILKDVEERRRLQGKPDLETSRKRMRAWLEEEETRDLESSGVTNTSPIPPTKKIATGQQEVLDEVNHMRKLKASTVRAVYPSSHVDNLQRWEQKLEGKVESFSFNPEGEKQ
jgi:hypothetical protein